MGRCGTPGAPVRERHTIVTFPRRARVVLGAQAFLIRKVYLPCEYQLFTWM